MPHLRSLLPALTVLALAPASARAHGCHHTDEVSQALLERYPDLALKYPGLMGHAGLGTGHAGIGTTCLPGSVTPPTGWHNGDTHTHMQWCGSGLTGFWIDAAAIYNSQMVPANLDVSSNLLWGAFWNTALGEPDQMTEFLWDQFVADPADGVTGDEHEFTAPLSDALLHTGVEVSGFSTSRWGHVSALNLEAPQADVYADRADLEGEVGCEPLLDPAFADPFNFTMFTNAVECGLPRPIDGGYKNDGTGDYALPHLQRFRSNPDAVTGYAHQFWPVDEPGQPSGWVDPSNGGWNWQDPHYAQLPTPIGADLRCLEGPAGPGWPGGLNLAFPNNFETFNQAFPVMLPMDVAMGWVDYLEAWDLEEADPGDPGQETLCLHDLSPLPAPPCGDEVTHLTPPSRWYGAYYKLLSSGLRPSIAAGSDSQCATSQCVPQTWVKLKQGESLDYDAWTRNLRDGRVTLSSGNYQIMEIKVNGRALGAQVGLSSPATAITVEVFYRVVPAAIPDLAEPERRTIELVLGGEVVHTIELDTADLANNGGNFYASVGPATVSALDLTESTWVAARMQNGSAHTASVYAVVDGEPIVDCMAAEYWMLYCDYLDVKIDGYARCADPGEPNVPGLPEFLEEHVGCSEAAIRAHVEDARRHFSAVRDYAAPLPPGVERVGQSLPQPQTRPMGIGTGDTPVAGSTMTITCFGGPPNATGFFIAGVEKAGHLLLDPPLVVPEACGAGLAVVSPFDFWFLVQTNEAGYAEITIPIPSPSLQTGDELFTQFFWLPPGPCQQTGDASSSAALRLTVQ